MWILVLGFKEQSSRAKPELIYTGNSGDEALAAVEATKGKGFVRIGKVTNAVLTPMRVPDNRAVTPVKPATPATPIKPNPEQKKKKI